MRYSEAKKKAVLELKNAGIDDAETDSVYLMLKASGVERNILFMKLFDEMPEKEFEAFRKLINRRCAHEPLQYILGSQEFMGFDFTVTPDVLIPRFDTEILAEHATKRAVEALKRVINDGRKTFRILDLCTGSGCVAVSVGLGAIEEYLKSGYGDVCKKINDISLKEMQVDIVGADISEAALTIAGSNYKKNLEAVECKKIFNGRFIKSDLFENIEGRFDIITANPPYIVRDEIDELMPEVKEHEPRIALDGGQDGMDFYRRICKEAPGYLYSGGRLLMEFDDQEAAAVSYMMCEAGFNEVTVHRDLAGLQRVIEGVI